MRLLVSRYAFLGFIAAALFGAITWEHRATWQALGDPGVMTGWYLLGTILVLGLLNPRKKLAALPFGSMRSWLALHIVLGMFALALFWLHTGKIWPTGIYEQALAALFYAVCGSGILGYAMQRFLPKRLNQTGIEVVYERVPAEIANFRSLAESLIIDASEETGHETLARHYLDSLAWFFERPRFRISHVFGGDQAYHWLRGPGDAVRRHLNHQEIVWLDRLQALAEQKRLVDRHYACQAVLKKWLLIHVPLSAALIVLALWHTILVLVFVP